MAGGEVEGLVYGGPHGPGRAGWVPVNAESTNPSLTLVGNPPYFEPQHKEVYGGNPPITEPLPQGFPPFEPHQKKVYGECPIGDWVSGSISPWQESNAVLEWQQGPKQEEVYGDWVSRPTNPWEVQQTNSILERQQEGGIFPSLQLRLPDIALGGILLSLLGTVIIG